MTTYYVNSATGNNGNNGLSSNSAWKTIQYAVTNGAVNAGDTIKLSGAFSESVLISDSNGGRQGNSSTRIVLESLDPSNPAVLTGTGGFATPRIRLLNRSGWEIRTLLLENYVGSGIRVDHSSNTYATMSNIVIDSCTFRNQTSATGGASAVAVSTISDQYAAPNAMIDDIRIANCTFNNIRSGVSGAAYNECLSIAGKVRRCVISGNTIDGATFIAINIVGDFYNPAHPTLASIGWPEKIVIRGNTIKNCKPSYLEGGSAWAGMIYANKARWVLIENNYIENDAAWPLVGVGVTGEPYSGIVGLPSLDTYIVRNNTIKGRGYGLYIGTQHSAYSATKNVEKAAIVHNTCVMLSNPAYPLGWLEVKSSAFKNNVFSNNGTNYLSYGNPVDIVGSGNVADGNLYYTASAAQGGASWRWQTAQYTGFATYKAGSGQDANAIWGQPTFEANYQLQSTSPGYAASVPLTTATGSGSSSTTLPVAAGFYFYDGWGITGETGDQITIGGQSARVTAVTGNTITINTALTWSNGAPVSYSGGNNIGIFASNAQAPAPTGRLVAHATFNQIGVHLAHPDIAPGVQYVLRYRTSGGAWRTGIPAIGTDVPGHALGNVLYLQEGTSYEIEVTGPSGAESITASTRTTPVTPPASSALRERWVSPSGSGDTYTASSPGNLHDALSSLRAGDHIILMDGIYYNAGNLNIISPGTAANPVVLRAAPGASPRISGADPNSNTYQWTSLGGGIWQTTLPYTAGEIFIDRGAAAGYERLLQPPTYAQFQNFSPYTHPVRWNSGNTLSVHLPDGASPATLPRVICKENARWARIDGAWLIVDGIAFEYWWNQLLSWKLTVEIYATDATFRNCRFNRTGTFVPGNGCDRLLVENCDFEDGCGALGYASVKESWYSTTAPVDDASCILSLGGGTFKNGVIRRNRFANSLQSISIVCQQGSLATTGAINLYIEGNEARCIAGEFPEVDGRAAIVTIKDNVGLGGTTGLAISKPKDGALWVLRNLWANTGQAMLSPVSIYGGTTVVKTNSDDTYNIVPTYLINNTFYSEVALQYGVYAIKILSTAPDTPFVKLYAQNNIFFTSFGPIWIQPNASNHIFNYNLYRANTWTLRYGASSYASVAAWNAATGQETNGLQSDPLFSNKGGALAADYELQGGSPAINAGLAISGIHDVWQFDNTPNMGYGQGTATGALSANFTAAPVSGNAPLTVQFTDASVSSATITSRLWDFGDDTTSTATNPQKTYNAAGTYTVKKTVTTAGGSHTVTKAAYIQALTPTSISADFAAAPVYAVGPTLVKFTNLSAPASGKTLTTYLWERSSDNGATWQPFSTVAAPEVTFYAGCWTVRLTVTDSGSNSATVTKP